MWGQGRNPGCSRKSPAIAPSPFHSRNAGPSNRVWLKDAQVDELIDKGKVTPDGPEREAIYTQLWNRINELTPWVYLTTPNAVYAKGKNVKGADDLYRGLIHRLDQVCVEQWTVGSMQNGRLPEGGRPSLSRSTPGPGAPEPRC